MKKLLIFSLFLLLPLTATAMPTASLTLVTQGGKTVPLKVWVADTFATRKQGMMHRTDWKGYDGMWFDFGDDAPRSMWMKDTPLPLDMLFVDYQGIIRAIVSHTTPYSLETIQPNVSVRYVLEVPAGDSEKHAITTGDRIQWSDTSSAP